MTSGPGERGLLIQNGHGVGYAVKVVIGGNDVPQQHQRNHVVLKNFVGFSKCLLRMPFPWPIWIMALMAANMIGPLFFLDHLEGQVVLAVFVVSAGLMMILYAARGFTRILGAGHVFWLGLLPWLWSRLDSAQPGEWLSHWIIAVIVVNGLSLVIDVVDVVRYVRGDRQPTVASL
jgi:hypothetical protein